METLQDAKMPRRRSSSSNATRIVQVIFAIAWLIFLFYIVSGYFKKSDPNGVADNGDTPPLTPGSELPGGDFPPSTAKPLPSTTTPLQPKTGTPNNLTSPTLPAQGPTANEIIQRMKQTYRSASAYSDDAELTLFFSLNGGIIDEKYNWSTAWQKSTTGRGDLFSSSIFDVRLRSDGDLLSCYVFDVSSQNLDEQQLFLKTNGSLPLPRVWSDPIANYYLNGGEKIPINESAIPNRNLLLPPAITLVSAQSPLPWFANGNQYKLNGSEIVDEAPCHVLQGTTSAGNVALWVDKSNFMLRKMRFPNRILASELAANPAVENLELSAKFKNPSFPHRARDRSRNSSPLWTNSPPICLAKPHPVSV